MKIALAQLNYHIGNFEANRKKIIDAIHRAGSEGASLILFSELSVCGYPPLDFLDFSHFNQQCRESVERIASVCTDITAIVGAPSVNPVPEGKNLFNSAWVLQNGRVEKVIHKTLLPTYDVFDEYRYFEPGAESETIVINGQRIALTICEDLWNMEEDPLYRHCPMDRLIKEKPALIINIAASPFNYRQEAGRKKILQKNAVKYGLPVYYVNQVGAQTELIFDGGSMVVGKKGDVLCEMKYFEEDFQLIDTEAVQDGKQPVGTDIEKIHLALILGIKDYFRKMNFSKSIIGMSGGIDSAVVHALAVEALGSENVYSLMMPSAFSSGHSVSDAIMMCEKAGSPFQKIPINNLYDQFLLTLSDSFKGTTFNITEENLQARIRACLLMAMSNKFGYILLNTSNKSEIAVGYGTLYGDMCGGLSVIGDLFKTQVYQLARYINRKEEIIPESIILKEPSAELRPGQKDTDSLPKYEVLDKILHLYIENFRSPEEIVQEGFDQQLVLKVLKMVNTNEYKRKQFAPILRISPKAFGMGRRMPIVGQYLS